LHLPKQLGNSAGAGDWADLGTGSGAIALGRRRLCGGEIHAVDCSPLASAIALRMLNSWDLQTGFTFIRVLGGASGHSRAGVSGMVANPPQYSGAAATTKWRTMNPRWLLMAARMAWNVSDIW